MQQMYGRTARQGNEGSVRIICMYDQYISSIEIMNKKEMKNILNDFQFQIIIKKIENGFFQVELHLKNSLMKKMTKLREARINVNRIAACNYEYQICMSISSFLMVQAQKIYSLFNCPNCKYK